MHVSKHSIWCLFCVNFLDQNTLRGSLPLNCWDSVDTIFPFPIFREFSARRAFNTGYGDQMFFWPGRICHIVFFCATCMPKHTENSWNPDSNFWHNYVCELQSFPWWFAMEGQPVQGRQACRCVFPKWSCCLLLMRSVRGYAATVQYRWARRCCQPGNDSGRGLARGLSRAGDGRWAWPRPGSQIRRRSDHTGHCGPSKTA